MAGSVSPDHVVTLKNRATTYLLQYFCFCSVDKNHHIHRVWINPFPQLLASHTLKMNTVLIKFNLGHSRKLVVINLELQFPPRDRSRFWNPDEERSNRPSGRLVKPSQYPSSFSGSLR